MRKRKVGKPKGSKKNKHDQTIDTFVEDQKAKLHLRGATSISILYKGWQILGLGNLNDLHELLNQLEGK